MTSGEPPNSGAQAGWNAALGGHAAQSSPSMDDLIPVPTPPPNRSKLIRGILIAIVVLAVVVAGIVLVVKKSKNNGSSASSGGPSTNSSFTLSAPSSSPSTSGAVKVANTATEHALQLKQALTAETNWGQLQPFLANLSAQAVPTTCLTVTSSNESKCRFGAKGATKHAVLVGDVAALDYLPGIVAALAPHGWDVQVLTQSNCPISTVTVTINKVVSTSCGTHHSFVSDQISSIKPALIITSDSDTDLAFATAPPKPKGEPRTSAKDAYINGLSSAFSSYAQHGKVVYVGSPPGTKPIPGCQHDLPAPKACAAPPRPAWQAYQSLVESAMHGHATYLDPTPWFCSGGKCPAIVGVTPTYVDGVRVSNAFSASLSFGFASLASA